MSFHAPAKPLKPKEMKLEEGVVKGAVIVDENMSDWNPRVGTVAATSTYTTINKNTENLVDIVKRTADDLKLPDTEEYALLYEDPKIFVSEENLAQLAHGFLLTMTVAPKYFTKKLIESVSQSSDIQLLESSLLRMSCMSIDPVFVKAVYQISSIEKTYHLLDSETIKSNSRALYLFLLSMFNFLDANVNQINWTTVPASVIHSLAVHIIGQAKCEDSSTVLIVLQMMKKLVTCESLSVRRLVFSEVPAQSLIRHLEKSDERVNKAALSLINAFHMAADPEMKAEIVQLLDSVPFRSAIRGSVIRYGRIRDSALLEQLVPLQRLLLDRQADSIQEQPTEEQMNQLLNASTFVDSSISHEDVKMAVDESGLGQFGVIHVIRYLTGYPDDVRILVSENSTRIGGGSWSLIPMNLQCLTIVAELLNIIPSEGESVDQLLELLFTVDNSIDSLLSIIIQLFHRTWREMQVMSIEADKVGKVVRQQIRKAIEQSSATIQGLEEAISAFPYWKMQEIWKKEQKENESSQLSSQAVSKLRTELLPSIEGLVRLNRKNFIKRGYTFKRVHKGKSSKDHFVFWRLDTSEKQIVMVDTDADQFIEGVSTSGKVRKVNIKDISSVQLGDDGATIRKGGNLLLLRLLLVNHESITVSASSYNALCAWVDGLNDLIGQKSLSEDANNNIKRLLNIELRLRLAVVPQPKEDIVIPPLPQDFLWIKHNE